MSDKLSASTLVEARPIIEAFRARDLARDIENDAERVYRASNDDRELRYTLNRARSQTRAANEQLDKLKDAEAGNLAASRGWRVAARSIQVSQLIAGSMTYDHWRFGYRDAEDKDHVIDHAEYFMRSKPGKTSQQSCRYPAAILSHTYGEWERCVEFADIHGLDLERLPYSWYYPGAAIAALFIARAVL
jgi:hypothetical protein